MTGRRSEAAGAQDAPHGRRADLNAEPRQFPVYPSMAPCGILRRQAKDQVPKLLTRCWTPRPMRVSPGPS
jgi:hypothetical protein